MPGRLLNLTLAAVWLVVGAAMLWDEWKSPEPRFPKVAGIPVGWFALLFAAYNVARWYLASNAPPPRRPQSSLEQPRPKPVDRPAEYLPDFDFQKPTDPPA